jgi:hypothetical protein
MGKIEINSNGLTHFKKCKQLYNTNIYSYLETSGGQNFNVYLNVVSFFSTPVLFRHLWQLKTAIAMKSSCKLLYIFTFLHDTKQSFNNILLLKM